MGRWRPLMAVASRLLPLDKGDGERGIDRAPKPDAPQVRRVDALFLLREPSKARDGGGRQKGEEGEGAEIEKGGQ